jgi:CheY-like chemotaxis protein
MRENLILIAEDDIDDRYFITRAFQECMLPEKIHIVATGQEVLEYLNNTTANSELPVLIVLDLNMPVLDGMSTLAKLKSTDRFKNIPVVILSTSRNPQEKEKCLELGAVDHLEKGNNYSDTKLIAQHLHKLLDYPRDLCRK